MTDLRDLSDYELIDSLALDADASKSDPRVVELARRLADLREQRDEAYEDSRRSLDRVNRLIGGLDESKDLLAAVDIDD